MPAPPGIAPAPTRRNHVSGKQTRTAVGAALGPPGHGEGAPGQAPLVNDAAAKLQVPLERTTAHPQNGTRRTEPVHVWAHAYVVVGTRGRSRLVLVVPSCVFCGRPHAHNGRPDFTVGKRTASCHEGRYVVHPGTVAGQVAA